MKKKQVMVWLLAVVMMVGYSASAQEATQENAGTAIATANATVVAPEVSYVTAPFAGTLLPFAWNIGERVAAQDALFTYDTVKVYASTAGVLGAVFAAPGDDAEGVMQRYGALCSIEPAQVYYLDASTSGAYNDEKNKFLHVGQTIYLKSGDEEGEGRVTSVSQGKYTVEILDGDYDLGESVKCYRESKHASNTVTGSGTVQRYDDVAVTAAGRVFAVHKQAGDTVAAGDLLLEMIDGASQPATTTCDVVSPVEGAVSAVHVAPGTQVYQGQLLCEVVDMSKLELSVQMDEIYLAGVKEGDILSFVLDAYADKEFQGAVTQMMAIGSNQQNAAYYDVRVALPADMSLLPGMNATVYIPR